MTASPGADCAFVAVRDGEEGGSEVVWTEGSEANLGGGDCGGGAACNACSD